MVRIRLRRVGGKKQPSYRIVAADKESPRDGRFLEILGFYNPRTEPTTLQMHEDRIYDWMSKGAQPSESVEKLFRSAGVLDRFARYKEGESLEVLMQEAEAAAQARAGSPKTTHIAPAKKPKDTAKVKKEAEAEALVESKVEEKFEPEVEAPAEPEAEAEAPAELETEAEAPTEPETEAEIPAEPETEAEAPTEPEAEAEAPAEPETEAEAPAEPETEAEAEPETETPADPKAEA
jgi:small subunit ribosomal protein S16